MQPLLALLSLFPCATSQESAPATRPQAATQRAEWTAAQARTALQELERALDRSALEASSAAGVAAQRALVESFLANCPLRDSTRTYRLMARARIAAICLFAFDLACAEEHFTGMREEAEGASNDDFRHHALYGLAQAAEMRGDVLQARTRYQALLQDRTRSRYTDFAGTALEQLRAKDQLVRGDLVQRLPARMDLHGAAHPLGAQQEQILLLLFWSPDSKPSRKALAEAQKALAPFRGEPAVSIVTVALDAQRADVARAAQQDGIVWPVLWETSEWMDPLAVRFGVRTLPASVLIGPGSRFVAADLPPAELATTIAALLGNGK